MSLATASRVLNGSTRKVADSYRARVEASAERLGYTANLSAQATARGTSAIVALLVADIADPYFGQIASGVARGADEAGLVVTIAITERDPQREVRLVRALRGQRPRGLILAASRTEGPDAAGLKAELDAFAGMGGRVVMLGPGGVDVRSVAVDNRGGSAQLGAALAELGYREAVIIGAEEGIRTSDDRIAGFTEGFTGGGGTIREVRRAGFTRDAGYAAAAGARSPATCPRARSSSASATSSRSASCRRSGMPGAMSARISPSPDSTTSRRVATSVPVSRPCACRSRISASARCAPRSTRTGTPRSRRCALEVIVRGSTPPRG